MDKKLVSKNLVFEKSRIWYKKVPDLVWEKVLDSVSFRFWVSSHTGSSPKVGLREND